MISAWTKHLKTNEEIELFKNKFRGSRPILERQNQLLDEMEADLDAVDTTYAIYDKPNWEYRQADNNGFRRCLRAIRKLNSLDQD